MSQYLVTLRSQDLQRITLNRGDTVVMSLQDPSVLGAYTLCIEGLVSVAQQTRLNGELSLMIDTQQATLHSLMTLTPTGVNTFMMDTAQINLSITRNLTGSTAYTVSCTGSAAVSRFLSGSTEQIELATTPAILSTSVFALVSDWSEVLIGDISEKIIDNLVYKEVGG